MTRKRARRRLRTTCSELVQIDESVGEAWPCQRHPFSPGWFMPVFAVWTWAQFFGSHLDRQLVFVPFWAVVLVFRLGSRRRVVCATDRAIVVFAAGPLSPSPLEPHARLPRTTMLRPAGRLFPHTQSTGERLYVSRSWLPDIRRADAAQSRQSSTSRHATAFGYGSWRS